jgi:hypothetical protein
LAWHGIASTIWNPWGFQRNVSINFGLWIICFSRSGNSSPSGSQIISWSDLMTRRTMSQLPKVNISPSLMPDERQEIAKLDRQLDSTRLVLPSDYRRCLMSDCEMSRIDKPTISSAFWNAYPAGYLQSRRKGFIRQSQ